MVKYKKKWACAKKFNKERTAARELKMLKAAEKSGTVPKIINQFMDKEPNVIIMELFEGETLMDILCEELVSTK